MFRRYSSSRRGAKGLAKSVFLYSYCWSITGSRGCVINVFFSSYFEEANNTGEFRHKGWKRGEVLSTLYFLHPCPRDKVGWAGGKIGFLIYVQQNLRLQLYFVIMYLFWTETPVCQSWSAKRDHITQEQGFRIGAKAFSSTDPCGKKKKILA